MSQRTLRSFFRLIENIITPDPVQPQARSNQSIPRRLTRKTVRETDIGWAAFFANDCESPAESGFLTAMIETFSLQPRDGKLVAGDLSLDLQVGHPPYRLDFLLNEWLIIEIDGVTYHSSPEAIARDKKRDAFFEEQGFTVIRIPASIVFKTPSGAIGLVKKAYSLGRKEVAATAPARERTLAEIVMAPLAFVAEINRFMSESADRQKSRHAELEIENHKKADQLEAQTSRDIHNFVGSDLKLSDDIDKRQRELRDRLRDSLTQNEDKLSGQHRLLIAEAMADDFRSFKEIEDFIAGDEEKRRLFEEAYSRLSQLFHER